MPYTIVRRLLCDQTSVWCSGPRGSETDQHSAGKVAKDQHSSEDWLSTTVHDLALDMKSSQVVLDPRWP